MFVHIPFILLLTLGAATEAARILVVFPLSVKSHVNAYTPFVEELARRGHAVTVVSAFPRKIPLANYTDIVVGDTFPPRDSKDFNLFEVKDAPYIASVYFIFNMCYTSCVKFLKEPNMQKLIHSKYLEFDLIIYEAFYTECTYGLLHKFKVPAIQIIPNTVVPWNTNSVGNPSTLSYIPVLLTDTDVLDFPSRISNFLRQLFVNLFRKFFVLPKMDALLRENFPDPSIPSIEELESKTTFMFLHSHPVFNYPRPFTPNTVEVGGLHIRSVPQKLPEDLQNFLDSSTDGVIFFSLGSNVRGIDMPERTLQDILNCFSKLKEKVLWKLEADTLPGQPNNVRLGRWLPQQGILAHSNVKLFISHAGLLSIQEATYYGVPLIVIPIMGDQMFNALRARSLGSAFLLDASNITEKSLCWAIDEVLHKPSYRANVKRLSGIMRDQPQSPLDRAIFWTEYAIRHKGAPHLHSQALKLNIIEYYLLDVIAVLLVISLAAFTLLLVLVRTIARHLCSKSKSSKATSRGKKQN